MDSMLSSTLNGALSQRESSTAVDPSDMVASSAAEPSTNRGVSAMDQFSAAEMDFEARNWRAARDVFQTQRGHKDKSAMAEFLRQQESPQQAQFSCMEASQKASKQYAPRIGGILSKIEAYMKVGDIAMKTAPESVGLAWMGVRLCMHSVEDDFSTFNLFSGAASDIIGILISCRVYGKMYGGDGGQKGLQDFQELHGKVVDYIPAIYTDILEFSYQMSKQMGRNTGVRILKGLLSSAVSKFKPILDGIRGNEKQMSEYAKKATDQLSIYYAEVSLQKQGTALENQQVMMADLNAIQSTLDSLQNTFVHQFKQFEEEKKNLKKKTPLDQAKEKFKDNAKRLKPTFSSELAFERNLTLREQGTCEWIFEVDEYKSWQASSESRIVWVSGVGGMGKSKSKGGLQQKKVAASNFEDIYPSLALLLERKIFLVIDALDECIDRKEFLRILQSMLSPPDYPDFRLHVLVGSRPETDIGDAFTDTPIIKVEEHNGPDIERAARLKLDSLPGFSITERELACEAIVKKAKGLFRCVDPAIEFLKKPLQRPLQKALARLPEGLDDSYQQTFNQTDSDYFELLKVALQWTILGQRKPTVAEIMDDYSNAYAQDEGSPDNPYDNLEDPTKPEETKRLIHDQIRKAGSSTFLEISGDKVNTRHTTVTDFFLRTGTSNTRTDDHYEAKSCPNCNSTASRNQEWRLTHKEGHLRMAIVIFKHLNSPLFRRRYLSDDPEVQELASIATIGSNPDGPSLVSSEHPLSPNGTADENINNGVVTSAGSLPIAEDHSNIDQPTQQTQTADPKADGGAKAEIPSENAGSGTANAEYPSTSDNTSNSAIDGGEGKSTFVELDHLTDKEDGSEGGDSNSSSLNDFNVQDQGDRVDDARSIRYELAYWPYHLREAEKLWTRDEKFTNSDWQELWGLVVRFLCDSPNAFQTWQRHYLEDSLDVTYWFYDVSLSPLHVAAAYGMTEICEVLIKHGHSAAAETDDGRSALWFAAGHSPELVKLLLEHGASPNACKLFPSPLQRLLERSPTIEGVKLMLDYKGDCGLKDDYERTAIHYFGLFGSDPETLQLLLANGGVINAIDRSGETGLHKLMWQDPLPLPLLLEFIKSGADVNLSDKESQQPLYEVCNTGSVEGARILIDHGANIEHADAAGITALHIAASNGHLENLKLLIERDAPLMAQDKHSRTPFYLACANGHVESARYLLGAAHEMGNHDSVHQAMDDGRSPFSKACGRGHVDIVKMLLNHADVQLDVNAIEGVPKRTALHWASYNARVDVVSLLLENGAKASIADSNGKTPLSLGGLGWMKDRSLRREPIILGLIELDRPTAIKDTNLMAMAALHGSIAVVEKLLDAQAPPNKQDEHGWTPLQLARQYGHADVAAVLERCGAIVGSSPSKWSVESKKVRIIEDGRGLEFVGPAAEALDPHMILANHPIPAGTRHFYFEIEITSDTGRDKDLWIAVGFATQPAKVDIMPGWPSSIAPSWGFHGDDGWIYGNNGGRRAFAAPYGKGTTIGCGVIFQNGIDGQIFYTRGGESLGIAFDQPVRGRLYPAVGMAEPVVLIANWGNDVEKCPLKWAPANEGRYDLDTVKVKGTTEYTT